MQELSEPSMVPILDMCNHGGHGGTCYLAWGEDSQANRQASVTATSCSQYNVVFWFVSSVSQQQGFCLLCHIDVR